MKLSLKQTQLCLRNSTVRIPFRYGSACLTRCPQAILAVTIESGGKLQRGYSGDCLPPSWFDKSPGKNYRQQIDDMLAVIKLAEKTFLEEFASPAELFDGWLIAYERIRSRAAEWQLTPLLASFGVSMLERAVMDAAARSAGMSFAKAAGSNLFSIKPGHVHSELTGLTPADWLPAKPETQVWVRHTVGLGDPLTTSEIPAGQRLDDGFPQALEQYVQQSGLKYFKIKVSNNVDRDLDRLITIAELVGRHRGDDYLVTLDGNEQYKTAGDFDALVNAIEADARLRTLWRNTLVVEQPLERSIALDPKHTAGIRELSKRKCVIIDESDGTLDCYRTAGQLGYRGVSSKNCKGPLKSLLNAGLTWLWNGKGERADFVMTGEDLCTVGIVPVQSDLCLTATLGMKHVERNGHHFHPGLCYLPESQQQAALVAHRDFYADQGGIIAPRLENGRFQIGSLQCVGYGFAVEPDLPAYEAADDWKYESLGLTS